VSSLESSCRCATDTTDKRPAENTEDTEPCWIVGRHHAPPPALGRYQHHSALSVSSVGMIFGVFAGILLPAHHRKHRKTSRRKHRGHRTVLDRGALGRRATETTARRPVETHWNFRMLGYQRHSVFSASSVGMIVGVFAGVLLQVRH
jgi:hypothetical protein